MTDAWAALLDAEYVLLDGSMGTQLFERGLTSGDSPELWNVDQPDRIRAVHHDYVQAGSGLLLTNSFGGTSFRLSLHGLEDRVHELNAAAAAIARQVADQAGFDDPDRSIVVAGSMGPTGELLDPLGSMSAESCAAAFAEQAAGLEAGGADVLWIETMSALEEVECAVAGIRTVSELPICATMSFDTVGRTMMGVTGTDAAERLSALDIAAIGANCGSNLADSEGALRAVVAARPDLVVIAKCNAGIPEWRDGGLAYDATPEVMAAHGSRMRDLGVRLIGGCCGSTPEHLRLMQLVLSGQAPVPDLEPTRSRSVTDDEGAVEPRGSGRERRRRRARTR